MSLADDGPVVIRYPKGTARVVGEHEVGTGLRARRCRDGDGSVCVLAIGKLVGNAMKAAELLAEGVGGRPIDVTVWDVRSCVPLDADMLTDAARHCVVVTAEDGIRDGGIGMTICERIGASAPTIPVAVLGVPTSFIPHAKPDVILARLGLDGAGIAASIRAALDTAG
jgi:1-deoxy-D-xylulose-5-phosphate synthase